MLSSNLMNGLPVGSVVKSLPASAGDAGVSGSIPGSGRSLGEGSGNPLVFIPVEFHGQRTLESCKGSIGKVAKNQTQPSD